MTEANQAASGAKDKALAAAKRTAATTRRLVADGQRRYEDLNQIALALRVGLGVLFVSGGVNKLSKLLSPSASDGIVASYTATTGYINEFFMNWMFWQGSPLSPWGFLTALSAFELVSGIMLIAGLLVRPLALIYAFLLWTFVVSLPVVTTNGVDPGVKTYMAPALFVQIRDVALSGMMFALYCLGSGARSLDARIYGEAPTRQLTGWEPIGLLLRLSLAIILIVGGLFAGMPSIKAFIEPGIILLAAGLAILWGGTVGRIGAGAAFAIVVVYCVGKLGIDKGLIGNFNAIKREIAFLAGYGILALRESGTQWTAADLWRRMSEGVQSARLSKDTQEA